VRVLMVNGHGDDPSCGGAERAMFELTDRLIRLGIEVVFLQAFPSRVRGADVERIILHRTDWRDDPTRRVKDHLGSVLALPAGSLQRAIARHRPDIVHTHNLPGIGTGVWEVSRRLGLPVIHTIWDYHLLCPRASLTRRDGRTCRPSPLLCGFRTRRLARWTSAVSHVIGCSQYVIDLHAQYFPHAGFHVLRNPVVVPDAGSVRPPRKRPRVLGYIGALDRIKGVHLLLEAAPRLESLGFRLRIAGDGRLRDEVARAVEQSANVEWAGAVLGEQKRRFFEACDLGLVPSVWAEPGGPTFTMVEWLAAGRPVLVSTRGGLGEIAGVYPGSVPLDPNVDSIVELVAGLRESARWNELVAAVRPIDSELEAEEWAKAHETLYRSIIV
jgi:glycosyltransferase involved in cell wall biosynthesis